MKTIIINNINIINSIIASIVFTYYIWVRFIRERLPRDIPFDLSFFSTLILLNIIFIFILIIKREIKPTTSIYQKFLAERLSILFKLFYTLNNVLRHNYYFRFICIKLFKLFFKFLFSTINYTKSGVDIRVLFFVWTYIPRILLLILFYIDIFYFHHLYFMYIFAIISLMPLLFNYFIYLMKEYQEEFVTFLETWYEIEELDTKELPLDGENHTTIRAFLNLQSLVLGSEPYKYKCSLKYEIMQKYYPDIIYFRDLTQQQRNFLEKDFYDLITLVTHLDYFFMRYATTEYVSETMKKFLIYIYLLYLIGWVYILVISLHTFHLLPFEAIFFQQFQDNFDPFSNILLKNNHESQADNIFK